MIKIESPEHLAEIRANRKAFIKARYTRKYNMLMRKTAAKKYKCPVIEDVYPDVVYERDKGICGLCKKPIDLVDYEMDHKTPLSRGGYHTYENIHAVHGSCNRRKHNKTLEEITS